MAITLLDLLSNEYLLLATTPYLLPEELLNLSSTSHSFYSLLTHSRSVWRHLNLVSGLFNTPRKTYQTDPSSILAHRPVLRDTKTLVLDTLPVTVEFLHSLLTANTHRIQLLSIRECPAINERQLMLLLQYLVRPSRASNQPSLKGLYYFTETDYHANPSDDVSRYGRFVKESKLRDTEGWIGIFKACEGVIAFDTRECLGPKHSSTEAKLGSFRMRSQCAGCGIPPEKRKIEDAPATLIPPIPITSSSLHAACHDNAGRETDVIRCDSCVKHRWCEQCKKWWCENCLDAEKRVSLDCYECGALCEECALKTARKCTYCTGGYCIVHDVNSNEIRCEWCTSRERRNRGCENPSRGNLFMNTNHKNVLLGRGGVRVVANARHFQDEVINRNRCLVTSS